MIHQKNVIEKGDNFSQLTHFLTHIFDTIQLTQLTKYCLKKNLTDNKMFSNELVTQHMVPNIEGTEGHEIKNSKQ